MEKTRLTQILLRAKKIVEELMFDSHDSERNDELRELLNCIDESLNLINADDDSNSNGDYFNRFLRVIDLVIKLLNVKNLEDFLE